MRLKIKSLPFELCRLKISFPQRSVSGTFYSAGIYYMWKKKWKIKMIETLATTAKAKLSG